MKYWLCCHGSLLKGADEQVALKAIMQITKFPEEKARLVFLSGNKRRIKKSDSRETFDKVAVYLRKAGVDVFVLAQEEAPATESIVVESPHETAEPALPSPPPDPQDPQEITAAEITARIEASIEESLNSQPPVGSKRRATTFAALFLLATVLVGIAGFAWFWLYGMDSERLLVAENALADGSMVAIGHADIEKSVVLYENFIGEIDPQALPLPEAHEGFYGKLFAGPADLRSRLNQVAFSINTEGSGDSISVVTNLLLAGEFDQASMLPILNEYYEVTEISQGHWQLLKKQSLLETNTAAEICEKEGSDQAETKAKKLPEKISYLFADHQWVLLSDNETTATRLWQRLQEHAEAAQSLDTWLNYRSGKLAAFMVFVPKQAAKSVRGFPGMIAQGVTQQNPDLKGIAVGASVQLPASLVINGSLFSDNASWNSETLAKGQGSLDEALADAMGYSPSMAKLFSRIQLDSNESQLTADVSLDQELITDMETVIEESLGSLFTPTMSSGNGEVEQERIDESPTDYSIYSDIAQLPAVTLEKHESAIYQEDAYAVLLDSYQATKTGDMGLSLKALIALPENRPFSASIVESASFHIEDIANEAGDSLLRNEICLSQKDFWGAKNHEPVTNMSVSNNRAYLSKELRFKDNVQFGDIQRIKGWVEFSVPTQVTKISLAAKTGETVEHKGVRVFLSRVKGGTIGYQVSGEYKRLIEVRGLNAEGKPLSTGWSTNQGGEGRASQSFKGEVKTVEVFIADAFINDKKTFDISDPLNIPVREDKKEAGPFAVVPERIDIKLWNKHAKLDMTGLAFDKKDWWGAVSGEPVSDGLTFPGVKMFVFHDAKGWSSSPQVGLYFPVLAGLPSVLSALSSTLEIPPPREPHENYHQIFYPYFTESQELSIKREHQGVKVATKGFTLNADVEQGQQLARIKGEVKLRIPLKMTRTKLSVASLWQGAVIEGVKVTLQEISWGMFPGYRLKVEGAIDRLVNLHGVLDNGERIAADPVNLQSDGYWTMTLPLREGMQELELILADKQKVITIPFDVTPKY